MIRPPPTVYFRGLCPGTRTASGKYPVMTGLGYRRGRPSRLAAPNTRTRPRAPRSGARSCSAIQATLPAAVLHAPGGLRSSAGVRRRADSRSRGPRRAAGDISSLHIKHLNPLPSFRFGQDFRHVFVVEMNDEGTLRLWPFRARHFLRSPVPGHQQVDGPTRKLREILAAVKLEVVLERPARRKPSNFQSRKIL